MNLRLKISHPEHSGRLRPHEHTSYAALAFVLVIVGVALTISSVSALSPGPQAGSIGINGSMPGAAPKLAPVFTTPKPGFRTPTSPLTVTGTCPAKTLVEVYKNDIFAGSGPCSDGGTFSFDVDLLFGENKLIARVYDDLNQAGPDSAVLTVYYDGLPTQADSLSPLNFGGSQLLLNTDAVFRGSFPGQEMTIPIDILGGTPPYAVNVQWGDSNNKVVPRSDRLSFNVGHTYQKAGTYQITLQATDADGRVAFLTVAAIINGQPSPVAATTTKTDSTNKLLLLWPVYTSAAGILASFWLGERREKHLLGSQSIALPNHG